jgi:type I restriction enzyme S subunit
MQRYDEYKESGFKWFGNIPENWEVKRLKYLFDFVVGFTPPSGKNEYYDGGEYTWITIADMKSKYLDDSVKKITEKAIEDLNPCIVPKDSLLYSFKLSVGKVAFTKIDTYTNEAIFAVLPNEDLNLDFYYYALPLQIIHNANENIYGAKIFNQELIKNAFLVTPPKDEQIIIADFLNKKTTEIDKLITQKEQLLALYEEEKAAIVNQAVTKGIDPDVTMKESGVPWLGEIPEHWEVKKFRFSFDLTKGLTITKANLKSSGIPVVNYGEIHSKYGFEVIPERDELKCVDKNYLETSCQSLLKRGDFVFADTSEDIEGSGNFTHLHSDTNIFAGYHTIISRLKIDANYRYLAYFFESMAFRNQVRQQVKGVKVYSITNAILKDTSIFLPSKEEQTTIVDFIENELLKIDIKIKKIKKIIALQKEYRTALISEVVTGKVKIPEEV